MCCHIVHCFTLFESCINECEFGNLCFKSSNWAITLWIQPKMFVAEKWRCSWSQHSKTDGSRNFFWVTRTLRIRQGQVGLKPWIPRSSHRGRSGEEHSKSIRWDSYLIAQFGSSPSRPFSKGIWNYQIVLPITKILQEFWLTLVFAKWMKIEGDQKDCSLSVINLILIWIFLCTIFNLYG